MIEGAKPPVERRSTPPWITIALVLAISTLRRNFPTWQMDAVLAGAVTFGIWFHGQRAIPPVKIIALAFTVGALVFAGLMFLDGFWRWR